MSGRGRSVPRTGPGIRCTAAWSPTAPQTGDPDGYNNHRISPTAPCA